MFQRLVCETSLGIGDSAGRMGLYYTLFVIPAILPFYFWDKTRQERVIAESRVEWVIVRPGVLTNGAKRGRSRHGHHVGSFLLTVRISRADVADFMLDQLASDTYLRTGDGRALVGHATRPQLRQMRKYLSVMNGSKAGLRSTTWAVSGFTNTRNARRGCIV